MHFLSENTHLIPYFLVPTILLMLFWISKKYQELKIEETKKLDLLFADLASEKKIENLLKGASKEIKNLENATQKKLLKIKVDILNIDFTLREIF